MLLLENLTGREVRPHTVFASWVAADAALQQCGFARMGRRIYENERGRDLVIVVWPTGLVTVEWPEQFT